MAGVRIVDNHVVILDSSRLVLVCHLAGRFEEKTISELHDISFVNACNFLQATELGRKII